MDQPSAEELEAVVTALTIEEAEERLRKAEFLATEYRKRVDSLRAAKRKATLKAIIEQIRAEGFTAKDIAEGMGYKLADPSHASRSTAKVPSTGKKEKVFRDPDTGEECALAGSWRQWVRKRIDRGCTFEALVIDNSRAEGLKLSYEDGTTTP